METTEKIVESYVRYVKGWPTTPNIKTTRQFEIDLLAIDPVKLDRYHIEATVSISGSFFKLTARPYSEVDLKTRLKAALQRLTIGYFEERKFAAKPVLNKLAVYGFKRGNYAKVIVSWGWNDDASAQAKKHKVERWNFQQILREIAKNFQKERKYFTDDTLPTLQLFSRPVERDTC